VDRTINREIVLWEKELRTAVFEYLKAKDIPVGDTATFKFDYETGTVTILSTEVQQVDLEAEP